MPAFRNGIPSLPLIEHAFCANINLTPLTQFPAVNRSLLELKLSERLVRSLQVTQKACRIPKIRRASAPFISALRSPRRSMRKYVCRPFHDPHMENPTQLSRIPPIQIVWFNNRWRAWRKHYEAIILGPLARPFYHFAILFFNRPQTFDKQNTFAEIPTERMLQKHPK